VPDWLLYSPRNTRLVIQSKWWWDVADVPSIIVIESPISSLQGAEIALLKINVTISELDAEAAVQQTVDANATMARAPDDPTDQVPPAFSGAATAAMKQFDLGSVLKRLEGFMELAKVAAEVRRSMFSDRVELTDRNLLSRFIQLSNSHGESYQ
jgi:hypothetical protein